MARCYGGMVLPLLKNAMVSNTISFPSACHLILLRLAEYKPILEEVERILAEAGLDEEEMRKGAAAGLQGASGQSRNRR